MSEENNKTIHSVVIWVWVLGSYLAIISTVIVLFPIDWIYKAILIAIVGFIFTHIIFLFKMFPQFLEYRKFRKYCYNLPLLVYAEKIEKEVFITDHKGSATIIWRYKIKNISQKPILKIAKTIIFEGSFNENKFKLDIDGTNVKWDDIKDESEKYVTTMSIPRDHNYKFIPIEFKNGIFGKRKRSLVNLEYELDNVYWKAFTKGQQADSNFLNPFPTDKFELTIHLKIQDYKFKIDNYETEQIEFKIMDYTEKDRLQTSKPYLENDKLLKWNISKPKIGYNYRVLFHCEML